MVGASNHNWDPYWSSSLFGGIAGLSYNATAKTLYCNTYVANAGIAIRGTANVTNGGGTGGTFGAGSVCDPGFTISEIGLVTRWTPVKNLTFSVEVLYAYLKTNMAGTIKGAHRPRICRWRTRPTASGTTVRLRWKCAFSGTSDPDRLVTV